VGYPGYCTAAIDQAFKSWVIPTMFATVAQGKATAEDVHTAAGRAVEAQKSWAALPFEERARVLRRAGEVLEEWRFRADQPETYTRRLMGSALVSAGGPMLALYFRFDRKMDPTGRGRVGGFVERHAVVGVAHDLDDARP